MLQCVMVSSFLKGEGLNLFWIFLAIFSPAACHPFFLFNIQSYSLNCYRLIYKTWSQISSFKKQQQEQQQQKKHPLNSTFPSCYQSVIFPWKPILSKHMLFHTVFVIYMSDNWLQLASVSVKNPSSSHHFNSYSIPGSWTSLLHSSFPVRFYLFHHILTIQFLAH